jgi:CheY-like chemotaxis protein
MLRQGNCLTPHNTETNTMFQYSRFLSIIAVVAMLFAVRTPSRGDEKPDAEAIQKKKTRELLAAAEERYKAFYKRPETAIEFWAAIKFEMDLGKFDLAALHIKQLLEKQPADAVDKDLVKIEQAEGIFTFLRLERVRPKDWSDHEPFQKEAVANVEKLIKRTTDAVNTYLSDPVRIEKFIKQLAAATPEERSFAYVQLARSGERAMPYLIQSLRIDTDKPYYPRVREAMLLLGRDRKETVATYLDVLKAANDKDARDLDLRLTLLDMIKRLDDKRALPYLWHLSSAKQYPEGVRNKAREVQASLMRIDKLDIPPAKQQLVKMAEEYYAKLRAAPLEDKQAKVKVWEWTGDAIVQRERTPLELEEDLGLRYARQALDLDPTYVPAQIVFLNLMLERTYRTKLDQVQREQMPPKMQQLLTTLDAELAMRVLERALEDKQISVILPLIQTLGERGEVRAAKLSSGGPPRGIVRGLYYPDRRVQFAAVKAMLRMPASSPPAVAADRIVELARRFLASDSNPKALIVYPPAEKEKPARDAVKDLGYESEIAKKTHEAVEKGKASADYDLVVLHRGVPEAEFAFVYNQLRKDVDIGGLPMIVVVDKAREKAVRKFVGKDSAVAVMTEDEFHSKDDLKKAADALFKNAQITKLTAAEREQFSDASMYFLWAMARGEITGYDVKPAVDVVKSQLKSPKNLVPALEFLGRVPGKEIQYQLAGIVSDPDVDEKMRVPAAMELNRHMQKNGVQLDKKQIANLQAAANQTAEGSVLRTELNVTVSMIARTTGAKTGADLFKFQPDPPAKAKDKGKEEKKDKGD